VRNGIRRLPTGRDYAAAKDAEIGKSAQRDGFLEQEDGPEVFVHHSGINASCFKSQREGDKKLRRNTGF